ncbi:hypothetical protein TorRG33x02_242210 [Trema orientale]|uniref:Uncharacterized protein n=1 Tax=Trema orientale TaxID=63057 RepID=A0A2P5DU01_TREOI|nr:hypothetical protein TorRG33x02_242210 [Trema orientale]
MAIRPLPSIQKVFSGVRREESMKKMMLGLENPSLANSNESSTLVTRNTNFPPNNHGQRGGRPWCEHYKKPSHTKQTCWNLHGKPPDWKPRESRGYIAARQGQPAAEINPFSKEQLEILQKMFSQTLNHSQPTVSQPNPAQTYVGTGFVAEQGNFYTALSSQSKKNNSWIVDSGASDHITGNPSLFHTSKLCTKKILW